MSPKDMFGRSMAVWSLVAVGAALALGVVAEAAELPAVGRLYAGLRPLGILWLNSLQMTVIPLVATQILLALVRPDETVSLAKLGGRSLGLFIGLNLGAGVLAFAVASGLLGWISMPVGVASSLESVAVPESALQAGQAQGAGLGQWLEGLVPPNPFEAAAQGNILHILVFTALVGAAINRLPLERRLPLAEIIRSSADAVMILVGWILAGTPVGVFVLVLGVTLDTGVAAIGVIGSLLVLVCGLALFVVVLLYPVAAVFGRVSIGQFARAAAPAQIVAVSTQSSLAALPALIEGGKEHLDLPPESTGFVLPLSVAAFKMSTVVSPPAACIFFATVLGIPIGPLEMATFLVGMIFLSFTTVGVPRGGGAFRTLPFFLAVGIPIEAVVIIQAIKSLYDPFVTVLNTTGDMTVATLLSRRSRGGELEHLIRSHE